MRKKETGRKKTERDEGNMAKSMSQEDQRKLLQVSVTKLGKIFSHLCR